MAVAEGLGSPAGCVTQQLVPDALAFKGRRHFAHPYANKDEEQTSKREYNHTDKQRQTKKSLLLSYEQIPKDAATRWQQRCCQLTLEEPFICRAQVTDSR